MQLHIRRFIPVFFIVLMLAAVSVVSAQPPQRFVSGGFQLQGFPCDAPAGLCATGIATGDLAGEVNVALTSLTLDPATGVQSYTGTIEISSPRGTLSGIIVNGRLTPNSPTTVSLRSIVIFTDGTGFYQNRRGLLFVKGGIDLTTLQETDTYTGLLAVVPPSRR